MLVGVMLFNANGPFTSFLLMIFLGQMNLEQ